MAEAAYFHATLYKFSAEACKAVVARFKREVPDASVKCWYNEEDHMFCLQCPSDVGFAADEQLGRILKEYVDAQMTENSSDEPRLIERFKESSFDLFEDEQAEASAGESDNDDPPCLNKHCIRFPEAKTLGPSVKLRFLRLHEISEHAIQRVLTSENSQEERWLGLGQTLRAVRWNQAKAKYEYAGAPQGKVELSDLTHFGVEIFDIAPFLPFGNRNEDEQSTDLQEELQTRNVLATQTPIMQNFLEDLSRTEQVSPEQTAEPPSDARKFILRTNRQNPAMIKTRIAKGATILSRDNSEPASTKLPINTTAAPLAEPGATGGIEAGYASPEVADAPDESDEMFNNLFKKADAETVAPAPTEQSQSPPSAEDNIFNSLFKAAHSNVESMARTASTSPKRKAASRSDLSTNSTSHLSRKMMRSEQSAFSAIPCSSSTTATTSYAGDVFPDYGARFSKIDNLGLSSNPAAQAQWELQNRTTRNAKIARHGVQRKSNVVRPDRKADSCLSEVRSGAQDEKHAENTDSTLSLAHSAAVDNASPASWASVVVPDQPDLSVSSGNCFYGNDNMGIDSRTSRDCVSPFDWPELGSGSPQKNGSLWQSINMISFKHAQPDHNATLRCVANNAEQISKTNSGHSPGSRETTKGEIPVEQLAKPSGLSPVKRFTMRQRAGRKAKSNNRARGVVDDAMSGSRPKNGTASTISQGVTSSTRIPQFALSGPSPVNTFEGDVPQTYSALGYQDASANIESSAGAAAGAQTTLGPSNLPHSTHGTNTTTTDDDANVLTDARLSTPHALNHCVNFDLWYRSIELSGNIDNASLEVIFGIILVRFAGTPITASVRSVAEASNRLHDEASQVKVGFYPRLTTSELDACFILNNLAGRKEDVQCTIQYDIYIKSFKGDRRLIRLDEAGDKLYTICRRRVDYGVLRMHYPAHSRDAQASIYKDKTEDDFLEDSSIGQFVSSLQDMGTGPSFVATVPSHLFTVEEVCVRRNYTTYINHIDGLKSLELIVTESQALELVSLDRPRGNLVAVCSPREQMIAGHRLSWTCGLRMKSLNGVTRAALGRLNLLIDGMIEWLDRVGCLNEGPYTRAPSEPVKPPSPSKHW